MTKSGRLVERLFQPTDVAGLAAFRMVFGLLGLVSAIRFQAFGWVDELFVEPRFFFKFWGFAWVEPLSRSGMHALFVALTVLSALIAVGFLYRASIVLFFLAFTYLQLIDVTNYLNHYYLVSLLSLIMVFLPLHRAWSVDAWLRPRLHVTHFPAWQTYLLRFQVGVVYVFAGLAKLNADWLLHAQPLEIWLSARTSFPVLGTLFAERWMAFVMSWAGFLFDTTIVGFLLHPRTRLFAFAAVVGFHLLTGMLFPIGMFPVIMVTSVLVFFSPSWPRRLGQFLRLRIPAFAQTPKSPIPPPRSPPLALAVLGLYCAVQVAFPLRHWFYGTNVTWHEQGMRFAWKVMVREKNGSITYLVEDKKSGRVWQVNPRQYLTDRQERDFASQPDLILQLAHHIADDYRRRGFEVRVRVDALVSLNGRPAARLIDPTVDLAQITDGFSKASWILPAPQVSPFQSRSI